MRPHQATPETLIAPCGLNCALCMVYQAKAYDLNQQGFHRSYCPGCIPRGKHCLHMGDACERMRDGQVRFCFACGDFPCKRLQTLDKRYRTKYHQSPIENLRSIQANGMEAFLKEQERQWTCPQCGKHNICCHNGLCLHCDLDTLRKNRTYRWGTQDARGK